jgi:hypothetical protein
MEFIMKRLIIPAAFLALMAGVSGVQADDQSAEVQVTVQGRVPARCSFTEVVTRVLDLQENLTQPNGKANGGFRNGSAGTTIGTVNCNSPSYLSIKTDRGALKTGDGNYNCVFSTAFDNCIRYTATVNWDGTSAAVNANGTAAAVGAVSPDAPVDHIDNTPLVLKLQLADGGGGVVALGNYSDTLTIRVGADL